LSPSQMQPMRCPWDSRPAAEDTPMPKPMKPVPTKNCLLPAGGRRE
jgi:hypothetical protein